METTDPPGRPAQRFDAVIDRLRRIVVQTAFAFRWKIQEIFVFRPAYALDQGSCAVACGHEADFIQAGVSKPSFVWDARRFVRGWIEGFFSPQIHIRSSFTAARLGHPGLVKLYPHIRYPRISDDQVLSGPQKLVLRDLSGRFECQVAHSPAWTPANLGRALNTPISQAFCKHHLGADAYLGRDCIGSTEV